MKKMKESKYTDWVIGLVLMSLMLLVFYFEWKPMELLEYRFYDFGFNLRETPPASPVSIVTIDDASIAKIGRWPWPRQRIAEMVKLLTDYDARVIGIDIIYSESDSNQGLAEIRNVIKSIEGDGRLQKSADVGNILEALKKAEWNLDSDMPLATAIGESNRVVLPLYFGRISSAMGSTGTTLPDYLKYNSISSPNLWFQMSAKEISAPIPDFATRASALGHINVIPDRDGTVRSEPILINYEGLFFPSISLQMTLRYLNAELKEITASPGGLKLRNITIPVYGDNQMLISSFNKQYPNYSFVDVMEKKAPADAFKNRIVIIATTASGVGTKYTTPSAALDYSWVIHANVISDIINNSHIMRPDWAFFVEAGVIILFGILLAFAIPRLKAGISAVVSLGLLVILCGTALYLLVSQGFWIKAVNPSLLLVGGYIIIVSKRYLLTEKTKEHIEADSIETNKMLGLSFQGQGLLDMAFDKFRKCPVEDPAVKELLYNLALDFERKRMFNKSVAVYEHILTAGDFKDIQDRIKKLNAAGETMIFGLSGAKKEATVLMDNTETKPTLGRYEVVKELGRGAMGTVYLGKDPKIHREVAIKTLRYEEIDEDQLEETKKRFFREAEAAGKLSHPNIVTIFDVGEDYEIAYMAMELLDGADLTKYCQKSSLLPAHETVRIISAVAHALDYAHSNDVVHRDIKPANIMILKNGDVKVADFGIARVVTSSRTQTGVVLGTPSYMSPEQIAGQKVDGRSDFFSLGVVLYELLTGEKPFKGESIATLMFNITMSPPAALAEINPDVPPGFISIIEKALAKDRDLRYQSGKQMAEDLAECLKA
jgi:CHASE2 domain-containing sensor protein/tRNA A-37 threonylcarbamoyl transferase component Bud32